MAPSLVSGFWIWTVLEEIKIFCSTGDAHLTSRMMIFSWCRGQLWAWTIEEWSILVHFPVMALMLMKVRWGRKAYITKWCNSLLIKSKMARETQEAEAVTAAMVIATEKWPDKPFFNSLRRSKSSKIFTAMNLAENLPNTLCCKKQPHLAPVSRCKVDVTFPIVSVLWAKLLFSDSLQREFKKSIFVHNFSTIIPDIKCSGGMLMMQDPGPGIRTHFLGEQRSNETARTTIEC